VAGSPVALEAGASLTPAEAASLTFVPTENYFSPDGNNASFTFRAKDAAGEVSNASTVSIEVLGTNTHLLSQCQMRKRSQKRARWCCRASRWLMPMLAMVR